MRYDPEKHIASISVEIHLSKSSVTTESFLMRSKPTIFAIRCDEKIVSLLQKVCIVNIVHESRSVRNGISGLVSSLDHSLIEKHIELNSFNHFLFRIFF